HIIEAASLFPHLVARTSAANGKPYCKASCRESPQAGDCPSCYWQRSALRSSTLAIFFRSAFSQPEYQPATLVLCSFFGGHFPFVCGTHVCAGAQSAQTIRRAQAGSARFEISHAPGGGWAFTFISAGHHDVLVRLRFDESVY